VSLQGDARDGVKQITGIVLGYDDDLVYVWLALEGEWIVRSFDHWFWEMNGRSLRPTFEVHVT
jgi:hypothetical protein